MEENRNSPENSDESLPSPRFQDTKETSTSSPRRSRRGTQKRVVHVPLKEVEGSRVKGETNSPPSDSWAWRKYGQKPIKGSPYPRGYYRCSSSKGCPARKQVERSRSDPTMVMVTYSCEHNHPWPAARNNNHHHTPLSPPINCTNTTDINAYDEFEEEPPIQTRQSKQELGCEPDPDPKPNQKFTSHEVGPCGPFGTTNDQYGWFSDLDTTSSIMLESPLMSRDMVEDFDMATTFSIREDDESFFSDLGELPECATVFSRERCKGWRSTAGAWLRGVVLPGDDNATIRN